MTSDTATTCTESSAFDFSEHRLRSQKFSLSFLASQTKIEIVTSSQEVLGEICFFDPRDPEYQVSEKFKPNKERLWTYPKEQDGWFWAHNAIRFDLQQIVDVLKFLQAFSSKVSDDRAYLQPWEVVALQAIFDNHETCLHEHHELEDDVLAPFFKERFHYPEKLCDDHDGIIEALNSVGKSIRKLRPGDSKKDALPLLRTEVAHYQHALYAHLKDEEETALPLTRAYFTPEEYQTICFTASHSKTRKLQNS
ncbi:MAG: hypothetical protein SGARI_002015 [Bacillariaceae sp.]